MDKFITYYPIVFLAAAVIAIIALIIQASRMQTHGIDVQHGNQSTMRIDELMHNRNSGVPTAAVVDTLKADNIVYCGVEERS